LVCRLSSVAAAVVAFLVARRLRRRRLRRLTPPCTSCFSGPSLSRPASRSLVPSPSGALARALRSRRARGMAPGAGGGRQGGDESWPASIPQARPQAVPVVQSAKLGPAPRQAEMLHVPPARGLHGLPQAPQRLRVERRSCRRSVRHVRRPGVQDAREG
ncbi:unnamed protein product, partial [Prorocentrum cordatum]